MAFKSHVHLLLLLLTLAACTPTPRLPSEHDVAIQTLSLSDVMPYRQLEATVTGYSGVCERLEVRQRREDRTFFLSVTGAYTNPSEVPCPDIAREFTRAVTLELYGLKAGEYTVRAGELTQSFTVPAQTVSEPLVDTVKVTVSTSNPVQVQVTAEGYLGSGCEEIGDVTQRFEGSTFFVKIHAVAPWAYDCTPVAPFFSEDVALETADLAPGSYKVNVNGTEKTFTLP